MALLARGLRLAGLAADPDEASPRARRRRDAARADRPTFRREGDVFQVLDVLAKQVGVLGVFSDWPATTSFYANCAGRR